MFRAIDDFLIDSVFHRPVLEPTGISGNFDYKVNLLGLGPGMGSMGDAGDGPRFFNRYKRI
jgi:hypothetical protein